LDDEGAADDGLRGGRKEAGVFSIEINGGWPTWWSSRRFRHGEMKMKCTQIKREGRETKASTIWIFI
jgi:hypothetical protein